MPPRIKPAPCDGCPLDAEDMRRVEEGLQQLAVPIATIQWCKRVGIPVEAAERECQDLQRFFESVLANGKGQQGPVTGAP
jgi:ribosomal protein S12 methylthiotransferase accessory factor YcaO